MSIQLLSISHKTAPTSIRSLFAFNEEQQLRILDKLLIFEEIEEAVILSTCNRTELYCSGEEDNRILHKMQEVILSESGLEETAGIRDYILRFCGESAVHHLFLVTAGLDSLVIGEDQILGQVKQAYFQSQEKGYCKSTFNSLFRLAITAAKKIKTDTLLSKTSVSTASLALKKAMQCHGTLENKNIMIIGASGKIGGIVLKDALDINGTHIFVTERKKVSCTVRKQMVCYTTIPYEERYQWIDKMDVIISATKSPHYTITKDHFLEHQKTNKKRVFFDLAIPLDIESSIGSFSDTYYYNMEDMKELARQNNEIKLSCVSEAKMIIKEYEETFLKNDLYSRNMELFHRLKEKMVKEAETKSIDNVVSSLFFGIKEESDVEELEHFINIVSKMVQ